MDAAGSSRDAKLAALAAEQQGMVAGWQLLRLGFTRHMIRRRIENGRLYRVFRDVYALTPTVLAPGRFMAAALTYGAQAVLSHRSAGAIWELGPWPVGLIDVTLETKQRPQPGIRLHRATVARHVRDGFPVTDVARTLVDLASVLPLARLEEAFERAERLALLDVTPVVELARGRRGARKIHAILVDETEPAPTRSQLERLFRKLCKDHGLPLPAQNVCVHGEDVDAYWARSNVVAELDGFEFHRTRRAFERDRRKAAALERRGCRVLRFSWRQLKRDGAEVAATLRTALDEANAARLLIREERSASI